MTSPYRVEIQQTKAKKFCVCFVSLHNGKLVLKGEPINRRIDAFAVGGAIAMSMNVDAPISVLPWNHKWPKNAGPKKAKKK